MTNFKVKFEKQTFQKGNPPNIEETHSLGEWTHHPWPVDSDEQKSRAIPVLRKRSAGETGARAFDLPKEQGELV